jgi:hypothetical protein
MATFEQLQSGGIRGLLPPNDPAASKANRILVACAPAQQSLDTHLTVAADVQAETLATLESWRAALELAEAAMSEAYTLVQANPGTITSTTDGLGHTHYAKEFPPTSKEQPSHARR